VDLETKFSLFCVFIVGVAPTIGSVPVYPSCLAATFLLLLFLVFVLLASFVGPDVVALELSRFLADRQSAGWLVVERVWIVVVTVITCVRERDAALAFVGIVLGNRKSTVRLAVWRALADASASELELRHGGLPGQAGSVGLGDSNRGVDGKLEMDVCSDSVLEYVSGLKYLYSQGE
jgi:hypothetical protein